MDIERDLHRALRRTPAPPDLADRVLARIDNGAQSDERGSGRPQADDGASGGSLQADDGVRRGPLQVAHRRHGLNGPRRWLAAAAAVTMVATGTFRYYEYQRTASEAERVKQEIRLAFQITSEKLALAQQRVERSAQNASR